MLNRVKNFIKAVSNRHSPGNEPDVFVFATPRGGSTWFMELICSQKGFRYCSEPLDVRSDQVRRYSRIETWEELYEPGTEVKFRRYFDGIIDGRISFRNPNPFRQHYRPFTQRMVFKLIHGGMDRINWFRDEVNARVVLCLRHPVPVTLSRIEYPFLNRFLSSSFHEQFTNQQLRYTEDIIRSGTKLQKGVVAWCVHNSVPLRSIEDDWAVVTYEQAVVQPKPLIDHLCQKLELPDPNRIYKQLSVPSRSVVLSDGETRQMLKQGEVAQDRKILIQKWVKRVGDQELSSVQDILDTFDIDAYRADKILPGDRYWIGEKPEPDGI